VRLIWEVHVGARATVPFIASLSARPDGAGKWRRGRE
jgi:hypothetical protein